MKYCTNAWCELEATTLMSYKWMGNIKYDQPYCDEHAKNVRINIAASFLVRDNKLLREGPIKALCPFEI